MKLHNENVILGDRVYDMVRGYGTVILIKPDTFEVEFSGNRVIYLADGYQKGKSLQTLYWNKPYIIAPSKSDVSWVMKRNRFDAILELLTTFNV
jgi:hypothetical protein